MVCKASDLSMDAGAISPPSIPGFGPPFNPFQFDLPDLDLPLDLIEDLLELMRQLGALFPSGLFKANLDSVMKNVLDFIASILNQIAPFLSFYNFIMALLNLIICIIEVLCAIPNPLAVASKLKRLFSECLPPFLLLFPWLALIAMIIALILLILALLEYIITTILAIIEQIIRNILIFSRALGFQDAEATLAAIQKIASLLCFIESLLAILIAIAAIIAVIQALAAFFGIGICEESDEEGCCPLVICPTFIKTNKEIAVTSGNLIYFNQIGMDLSSLGLPGDLAALIGESLLIRKERWQLYDTDSSPEFPIGLIITPTIDLGFFETQIFWPDQSFDLDTPPSRSPYTIDMTLSLDPTLFGHSDILGSRKFKINDCVVVRKPRIGTVLFNNFSFPGVGPGTGTFDLEGGLVFEEDGETEFKVDGYQATLNTFIHNDALLGTDKPLIDDGYTIQNISFVWKINHPALAGHNLITVGCMPEVNTEIGVLNAFIQAEGIESVLARLPNLATLADDVLGAQQCATDSINKFRSSVTLGSAATFQSEITTCIGDLQTKVTDLYCESILEAVSQFKSSFSIDTNIQFTTRPITVTVILRDAGGTVISNSIPEECLGDILDKLKANATFGTVGDFSYDRDAGTFVVTISSDSGGEGQLTVSFDGRSFSDLIEGVGFENNSSISITTLDYEFVDDITDKAVRRGPEDVSGAGSE